MGAGIFSGVPSASCFYSKSGTVDATECLLCMDGPLQSCFEPSFGSGCKTILTMSAISPEGSCLFMKSERSGARKQSEGGSDTGQPRSASRGGRRRRSANGCQQASNGVTSQRLEELVRELFRCHDLNGDGMLEESELIRLNESIAVLHYGEGADTAAVQLKYQQLFRTKLDPRGRPVPYETFRTYTWEVLDALDSDPEAQELILEQFVVEAQCGRRAFTSPSLAREEQLDSNEIDGISHAVACAAPALKNTPPQSPQRGAGVLVARIGLDSPSALWRGAVNAIPVKPLAPEMPPPPPASPMRLFPASLHCCEVSQARQNIDEEHAVLSPTRDIYRSVTSHSSDDAAPPVGTESPTTDDDLCNGRLVNDMTEINVDTHAEATVVSNWRSSNGCAGPGPQKLRVMHRNVYLSLDSLNDIGSRETAPVPQPCLQEETDSDASPKRLGLRLPNVP